MESIKSAWDRIAAWYAANTPEGTLVLAQDATEEEIVQLENAIGFRLPEDLRASFAIHNGALNEAFLLDYGEFLSLNGVLRLHERALKWQKEKGYGLPSRQMPKHFQGPIKPIWWSPMRLRLMDNSGNGVMADFDPPREGQWGQIIKFDHEIGPECVLASSFSQWLHILAQDLEEGKYACYVDPEYGAEIERL